MIHSQHLEQPLLLLSHDIGSSTASTEGLSRKVESEEWQSDTKGGRMWWSQAKPSDRMMIAKKAHCEGCTRSGRGFIHSSLSISYEKGIVI